MIKWYVVVMFALFSLSGGVYSADVDLLSKASPAGMTSMSHRALEVMGEALSKKEVKTMRPVTLSSDFTSRLNVGDKVKLNINGSQKSVSIDEIRLKNDTVTFVHGRGLGSSDRLQLVKIGNSIAGTIYLNEELYKLKTIDGDNYLLAYDTGELSDHAEAYIETWDYNITPEDSGTMNETSGDSGDVIDVVVAYTSMFAGSAGDPIAAIELAVFETNTSFDNSGIATQLNLVHAYQTGYSDTGSFSMDLGNFQSELSTYGNELRALRDQYSADIMMLLTGNIYDGCGQARVINADESNAIAAVKESCSTGFYTFGHEIGHLMGARHTITSDPSITPFPYGHAYCNPDAGTWRTVMASGCPTHKGTRARVQQWSNPNVTFQGAVTGTAADEDNARVLNERRSVVANFRNSASANERTVVYVYGQTQQGQDMFIRGGLDHGYANANLGRNCDSTNFECALPIEFLNTLNPTTAPWKMGDTHLDWYGRESAQTAESPGHGFAEGTALDWTIDQWPSAWGPAKYYEVDGSGEDSENTFGAHFWKLDVLMDCSNTVNGWFELKSYISNGPGWEGDIAQGQSNGEPYVSQNHFAQCGRKNVFFREWVDVNGYGWRGPNDVIIEDL